MDLGRAWILLAAGMMVGLAACSADPQDGSPATGRPAQRPSTNTVGLSGQDLYQPCLLCHSTKEMQRGPILNGLPAWYVEHQVQKFRDGVRGANAENRAAVLMASAAATWPEPADISLVARHIQSLPVTPHLRTVRGDLERGRQVYAMCVPCHGEQGQGNLMVKGPPLNVQEDWYLLDQLRKFKMGLRGDHPRDVEGQAMASIMATLNDAQLRDVVVYVAAELFQPVPRGTGPTGNGSP